MDSMNYRNAWKAEGQYAAMVVTPVVFKHVAKIPTNELRLLLENAERFGFGNRPHANAYRAELAKRANECGVCGANASLGQRCECGG